ncbi:glycosyltransferase family 2 protein [Deinococcus sp. S9]|uniref:glycosyltransferase family 2 protein n=1 Tax=Deinococcus sp. S9 TaxID=2545754 RepID=UPI001F0E3384|nr:glycosyltransferase family 2 protein [Deinococcus sp. S9]
MEPRVGIVILNWNGWQDTVECLNSLQGLSYPNFEIIVVDNASTNDSVKQIRKRFPNIHVIESPDNGGFAKGNNLGIKAFMAAGVDYIWLLNNDTTVSTLALTEMVRLAQNDQRLGIVGSVLYEYDRPGVIQAWGGGSLNHLFGLTKDLKRPGVPNYITGASMLINSRVLIDIGFLEEAYFFYMEDVDFCLRAIEKGFLIGVASRSRVFHKGSSSLNNEKIGKSVISDMLFSESVGKYLRRNSNLIGLLGRIFIMTLSRIFRGETGRIPIVVNGVLCGYIK